MQKSFEIIAKTFHGLEEVLAKEIENIGGENITIQKRAVKFYGDQSTLYKANLWLRTAISILKPIASFNAVDKTTLYNETKKINWLEYLNPDTTFAINSVVFSNNFAHSNFPSLVVKDAIVDQIRDRYNKRPSIDKFNPQYSIVVHIADDRVNISLDSSGEPLFKRGYRRQASLAPINEIMAAGMILLSGWDKKTTLFDPMCGSGTILIEAALIAGNIPAGFFRENFGFMQWSDFDETLWNHLIKDAIVAKSNFSPRIIGCDISLDAVKISRRNIANAKLEDFVKVIPSSFAEYTPADNGGIIITNPPYDERLKVSDISALYKMMGDTLKSKYNGYKAWIISSNPDALKSVGLKHSNNYILFNGKLECRFREYSMYEGSRSVKNTLAE